MVWQPVGGDECEGDDEEGEGDEDEDEEDGTALPPPSLVVVVLNWQHRRRRIRQKRRAKVVAAGWGTELIQFHAAPEIYQEDDLKKRMNKRTVTDWMLRKNEGSNDHPPEMDVLPKTFLYITLAATW